MPRSFFRLWERVEEVRGSLATAVGLLKEEMRRLGSLIIQVADRVQVPAGTALAVDRELFSQQITEAVETCPGVTLVHKEVQEIPQGVAIIASGPLTSSAFSKPGTMRKTRRCSG